MASSKRSLHNNLGTLRRNAVLAKLALGSSRRIAAYKAKRLFVSSQRKAELSDAVALKTAEDVAKSFGQMKGAMMKLGQMASYLDTGLPPNVRAVLSTLQSDAPPMAPELASDQVKAALGSRPEEIFREWSPMPIAAASIGQVHSAVTAEGQAVAVKVQYPKIAEAIQSDLKKAGWMFSLIGALYPGVDPEPIVTEIRDRLTEEVNYDLEARNQSYFAQHFDGHPYIRVPKVFEDYSSTQVLTSELVDGHKFSEVLNWSQPEKDKIAETIFRFSFGAIYELSSFNGDPHPGNYLFHKDGSVTFLDFGLVKHFEPSETKLFEDLIINMVLEPDPDAFRAMVEDAGILSEASAEFSTQHVNDYFEYFYDYVMRDAPLTIDENYAAVGVDRLFDMKGPFSDLMKTLNVPPSLVVVQRITLGLMGIFGQLSATANWQAISREIWPFTEQGPSTPMGVEVATWEQRKAGKPNS